MCRVVTGHGSDCRTKRIFGDIHSAKAHAIVLALTSDQRFTVFDAYGMVHAVYGR